MPFKYNPGNDGVGPVQVGLMGVLPEEDPLPSEVVVDGGVLSRRRREALSALRQLLLDRPEDIAPEEWRVVVATLAPPYAHLPRSPGTPARALGVMAAAKECFPGDSPTTALRRFREVQARPAVQSFVADLRALEMLDVLEQRGLVREFLQATIRGAGAAITEEAVTGGLCPKAAPNEWAKVAATGVAACKTLVDMDALALRPDEVAAMTAPTADAESTNPAATMLAKAQRVRDDLRARVPEPA